MGVKGRGEVKVGGSKSESRLGSSSVAGQGHGVKGGVMVGCLGVGAVGFSGQGRVMVGGSRGWGQLGLVGEV